MTGFDRFRLPVTAGWKRRLAILGLAALSLLGLILGRSGGVHILDVFGLGAGLLAICAWRGRAAPKFIDNLLLTVGLLLFIATSLLIAIVLVVAALFAINSGGCVYGYYEPGQCK